MKASIGGTAASSMTACWGRVGRSSGKARSCVVVSILCLGGALAACGGSSSSPPNGAQSAQSKSSSRPVREPFTIFWVAGLTGANASQQAPVAAGLQAWAEVINKTGGISGHPVKVITCDNRSSVSQTVSCASTMPANVGVVLEAGDTGDIEAMNPIVQAAGRLALTNTPTANPKHGSNLYQIGVSIKTDIAQVVGIARSNNITRVGLVTTSDATGQVVASSFSQLAAQAGIRLSVLELAPSSVDATVQISQLMSDHVQMVYIGALGEPAIASIRAVSVVGIKVPIFVLPADVTQTSLSVIGKSMPDQIYGAPPNVFQSQGTLNGRYKVGVDKLEAQYKMITGKTWNTAELALQGAFLGSLSATIMGALGPQPTLAAAATFLKKTVNTPLGPIGFPATTAFQDGNLPTPFAEATSSNRQWGACQSGPLLKC